MLIYRLDFSAIVKISDILNPAIIKEDFRSSYIWKRLLNSAILFLYKSEQDMHTSRFSLS